ncbi:MAG TPA: DUF6557 family protein [Hanamia sp.]
MKLHELIKTNNWLSVELTLLDLYPDQEKQIEFYQNVYEKLLRTDAVESDIEIVLTWYDDEDNNEGGYVDVSGKRKIPEENNITESLAIEFTAWNKWLGMEIEENTLHHFSELEIISHCLYEMTFVSFDEEEIKEEMDSLNKTMDEFKNMTDEEKKANTTSWDDLLKELGDE